MTAASAPHSAPSTALNLNRVLRRLSVSYKELAEATGIEPMDVFLIAALGRWAEAIDAAAQPRVMEVMRSLLTERGATAAELASLFEPDPDPKPKRRMRRAPLREIAAGVDAADDAGGAVPTATQAPAQTTSEQPMLISKQVLTPAAAKHFRLFRNPFDGAVERPEQLFVSDEIAYVREAIWQTASNSGFMALIGESGAGKTTLLADLEERVSKSGRELVLIKPSIVGMEESERTGHMLKSHDLLHAIVSALDGSRPVAQTLQARTLQATRLLTASVRAGNVHLLAVEEAHRMPEATLRHLKRLHELREGRRPLLGILLLAQPELQRRLETGLRNGKLREVAQRCELITLPPLGDELPGYLACRMRAWGRKLDELVDGEAVPALADRMTARNGQLRQPMSYPLAANNLVTRAMNLAADLGLPRVTAEVVQAI